MELEMEAHGGGNHDHRSQGDGNVRGQAEPGRSPRRPGKARVLTEADLDMELEMEARGGGNHDHRSQGDGNVRGQAEPGRISRRPGKARVLTEADLDMELEMEARGGGNHDHRSQGDGNVRGQVEPGRSPRRPGKARVLTEDDLDMELEMEARGGDDCRDHDHHGHNGHGHHHGDAFSHGHSHSRWFGGYGQCHGFEQDNFTGGWINAGHAENVFGGTGFGRRIVPVARATRVRRRLYGALAVSGAYALAEVIAATISGSTALLADALHMLSDFISYALSIGILELTLRKMKGYRKVKSVDPDSDLEAARGSTTDDYDSWLTFGFGRVEVLGATGIILVVWIATLALVVEAFQRLIHPPEVDGMTVVITTLGGLVVDVALLRLLDRERDGNGNSHGHSHGTGELGARAMFLHVVGDLIGTIMVCVGGAIIWGTGGRDSHLAVVDPVSTLIFAVIVFATTFPFFKRMMRTLLEATPPGLDLKKLTETLESKVPGVVGIHCLHAWDVSPGKAAFMAHVHVDISGRGVEAMELVLRRATRLLSREFGIQHVTLQVTAVPEQGGFSACGQLRKEPEKCPICDGD